jgi:2-oxoglutarate ferredoxin oxidoreductase subunit alpha
MHAHANGDVHVLFGGEAGQGLDTVGEVFARCLVRAGFPVLTSQTYESRIRGGHNTFSVRTGVEVPSGPAERIDCLMALNDETVGLHRADLTERGIVLVDESYDASSDGVVRVPYGELASGRFRNTAALGIASAILGLDQRMIREAVEERFGKKSEKLAESNRQSIDRGYAWHAASGVDGMKLGEADRKKRRLTLNGNHAIALGAASAGARFCAFYPMTPATSIPLTLAAHADRLGLVVEQAEDEIAAVNMALGASFAGAPALVATSGGGFALMVEGVSLAGMTETPIVIVVAQRPGPATGLPTRTEQADLEFVIHAGHGEFPRAVLSPGTPEECFHLTRTAFDLAERTQGPVFVLTDHFLADSLRDVTPFDVASLEPVGMPRVVDHVAEPYQRYAFTESGVSPRLLPGGGAHLVVADSDEHYESGHITEDLSIRTRMVDKRLRKGDILIDRSIQPRFEGDPADELLLVCWGSALGATREAADEIRRRALPCAVLHFPQVWPVPTRAVCTAFDKADRVACVESNATAQFTRLLARETGCRADAQVSRYDGLPLTAGHVVRGLEAKGLV